MSPRRQILSETTATRDRAEQLLRSLLDHKARAERTVPMLGSVAVGSGAGRRAIDDAIDSTRRMVETLTRVLDDMLEELSEDDLDLLARR